MEAVPDWAAGRTYTLTPRSPRVGDQILSQAMVRNDMSWRNRLRRTMFHGVCKLTLSRFEQRIRSAVLANHTALRKIIRLNANTEFGRAHGLSDLSRNQNLVSQYRDLVPLSDYQDYIPYIKRIMAGESDLLTSDPVTSVVGSAGTTDTPKRIPRTRRAQAQHVRLVALAGQAVIDRAMPAVMAGQRGINLMSLYLPPRDDSAPVPFTSGPNAGLARMRRQIALLYCSPVPVFEVADPPSALYLHALFGLRNRQALFVMSPFAPQITSWIALIDEHRQQLVNDLHHGVLSDHLQLDEEQRNAITAYLQPVPPRANEVERELNNGLDGIMARLWPNLRYIRTVTSGSFELSLPRLKSIAGSDVLIHSGCHSSTEGIIGLCLRAGDTNRYVLACGTSYFEFIPLDQIDEAQPGTCDVGDLVIGGEYEIVLTSCAGLYRYRLGDTIRITGFVGTAPEYEVLYRRGTILDLVGEKTTEFHTINALRSALRPWFNGSDDGIKEYSVLGCTDSPVGRYVFFVELHHPYYIPDSEHAQAEQRLEEALCETNEFYWRMGRSAKRLQPASLCLVKPGTFAALSDWQLRQNGCIAASQVKVSRVVKTLEQRQILEENSIQCRYEARELVAPQSGRVVERDLQKAT